MHALSHKLAAALAVRLGRVVPPGYRVHAQGSLVQLYQGTALRGQAAAAEIVDDIDDRSFDERIAAASRAVLSDIQDCLVESLGGPWPKSPLGGIALPDVGSDRAGERVMLWYGDEQTPTLALAPIEIGELLRGG